MGDSFQEGLELMSRLPGPGLCGQKHLETLRGPVSSGSRVTRLGFLPGAVEGSGGCDTLSLGLF